MIIRARRTLSDLLVRFVLRFPLRYVNDRSIVVDGRRVGNSDRACYDYEIHTAYFKKRTIGKRLVLHEFYHHMAYLKDWDISESREEREANRYARGVLRIMG